MSLLDEYKEVCCVMQSTVIPDGEGGYITSWTPGTYFNAAIASSGKSESVTGESMEEDRKYTIFLDRDVNLSYHSVVKRENGKYLRITASNVDQRSPASSGYKISWATAEEVTL